MHRRSKLKWKAVVLIGALLVVGGYAASRAAPDGDPVVPERKAIVYRSPTCGCCGNYVSYLKKKGFDVETKFVETEERAELGVPNELASCHTTVVDGYAIEGHVPVEAIEKLLQERPSVKGIGMPGMPSGSPGMPGPKRGAFDISSFTQDGQIGDFVKL